MAAALLAAAACALIAAPARAAAICGEGTYAYAGFTGRAVTHGVSATIGQAGPLAVHAGHVAGWIGVVDSRTGGAWVQVGLSAHPGAATSAIYVESAVPGRKPVYRELAAAIPTGARHRFSVLQLPGTSGSWSVRVDGRPAAPPFVLGGGHRWTAQVLGESWAGARSGACNAYSYAFSNVSLVGPRGAERMGRLDADANYLVSDRTSSGFVAASLGPGVLRRAEVQPPASQPSPPHHDQ